MQYLRRKTSCAVTRQQGHLEESLKHHEQQQALAEQLDHAEEIAAAQEQLVQARSMLAEAAADAGKHDVATSHLQVCNLSVLSLTHTHH